MKSNVGASLCCGSEPLLAIVVYIEKSRVKARSYRCTKHQEIAVELF